MKNKLVLNNIISFIVLVLVQVLILKNIRLGGYINPLLHILFIIRMPSNISGWAVLCLSFLLGVTVDIFSGNMGFYTFASTLTGFCRISLFNVFFSKHEQESVFMPSLSSMNFGSFTLYSSVLVFIHCFCYFFLETFIWGEIFSILWRSILSTTVTLMLILFIEFLLKFTKKR